MTGIPHTEPARADSPSADSPGPASPRTSAPGAGSPRTLSRRTVASGLAWTTPTAVAVAAAPFAAASPARLTATGTTLQMYQKVYTKSRGICNVATNPQVGYINTLCCASPAVDRGVNDADCAQNPNTSIGIWVEGPAAGTASIDSARITYTFSHPVSFDNASLNPAGASFISGTTTWSGGNVLGSGWSIESTTSTSITLVYTGSGVQEVSTATTGSGFCTGYFIPFHVTSGCYASGVVKVTTTRQVTWSDAAGPHVYSRTTGPSGV